VARRAGDRDVLELRALSDAAEHEAAAAHVAAADELARELEARAEEGFEDPDVLSGRDAAEQHDLVVGSERRGERARRALERTAVARLVLVDRRAGERAEVARADDLLGAHESPCGRDDEGGGESVARAAERARVRELSAEVEAAQEGVDVAERDAVRAQPDGEVEPRLGPHEHPRALAVGARGREQEHAARRHARGCYRPREAPRRAASPLRGASKRRRCAMPDGKTKEKAEEDLRDGKAPSTAAGEFVHEEIRHVREGKHGARSTRQAIAIGLSKARRAGVPLPPPKPGEASEETRRSAASDVRAGRTRRRPDPERSRATTRALEREPQRAASRTSLGRHAAHAAKRRSSGERRASARKGARTRARASRHPR
jgi:hypothetical protein